MAKKKRKPDWREVLSQETPQTKLKQKFSTPFAKICYAILSIFISGAIQKIFPNLDIPSIITVGVLIIFIFFLFYDSFKTVIGKILYALLLLILISSITLLLKSPEKPKDEHKVLSEDKTKHLPKDTVWIKDNSTKTVIIKEIASNTHEQAVKETPNFLDWNKNSNPFMTNDFNMSPNSSEYLYKPIKFDSTIINSLVKSILDDPNYFKTHDYLNTNSSIMKYDDKDVDWRIKIPSSTKLWNENDSNQIIPISSILKTDYSLERYNSTSNFYSKQITSDNEKYPFCLSISATPLYGLSSRTITLTFDKKIDYFENSPSQMIYNYDGEILGSYRYKLNFYSNKGSLLSFVDTTFTIENVKAYSQEKATLIYSH